jgi:hypothetical protein
MLTPHKHADLIKQWADGATIQFYNYGGWQDCSENRPTWSDAFTYRVKPPVKTPGQVARKAYFGPHQYQNWDDLQESTRKLWEDAAQAVLDHERAETIKSTKGEV